MWRRVALVRTEVSLGTLLVTFNAVASSIILSILVTERRRLDIPTNVGCNKTHTT
jgi:hypothetical protein